MESVKQYLAIILHRITSMKLLVVILFILGFSEGSAQQAIALFSSKRDSVEYSKLQATIFSIFQGSKFGPSDPASHKLDSLLQAQRGYRDKIIGYKFIYTPDKQFTNYQDLKSGKVRPEEVTKLSFSDSPLKALPREVSLCTNLSELELVNTKVRRWPAGLNKLQRLQSIYVYNNSIPGRLRLGRNTAIRTLVIRGVYERNLPNSYKHLKALETLDLSKNIGLSHFPNIYRNRSLVKLNLLENNLTLDDLKDGSALRLEELNLMKNKIKKVPDALGSFPQLKKLTFNYNEIAEVKPGIGNLKQLEVLSFYQNKLTSVPAGIFELENLRSIDLYFNQIQEVSAEIGRMKKLQILYLANNQLKSLPDDLGQLSNLRELYLHNNKISALPEAMKDLKSLRVLRINNNYFTSFPASILALRDIENLDVSKNYLYRFPLELSQFRKLEILSVLNNPWENEDDLRRVSVELRSRGTIVHEK